MMAVDVSQPTTAAGARAASVVLSPSIIRSRGVKRGITIGSLVGILAHASLGGFLHVTAVPLPAKLGKESPFILAPNASGPDLPEHVANLLARQNITKVHEAGVSVDLSHEKTIDGKTYREVGGRCPVYGKYIELYQPDREPYRNNFLDDVPTEAQHRKVGNPFPGGFGMIMQTASGQRFSPMTLSRLQGAPTIITAKTDLGRCAQYAYQTRAISPSTGTKTDYRFPFVYDSQAQLCYLLYISMQQMLGHKYCSTHGDPDVPWYCFKPMKNPEKNTHLVYGSAYVGEDPEYYVEHCPEKAVAGQKFGVWSNNSCRDYTSLPGTIVKEVTSKQACWALAFTNDGVATDQPTGYEAPAENPWVNWLPYVNSNWPLSHGKGYNYAVYYVDRHNKKKCALSDQEPTCFITDESAVSYTALSSLEETLLSDYEYKSYEIYTACDYNRCTRMWTREENGKVVEVEEVQCSEEQSQQCKSHNGLFIAGITAVGVIVCAVAIGVFTYFRRRRVAAQKEGLDERSLEFEADQQRKRRTRQSDLMQEAEPSFWDEADEGTTQEDQTNVVIENRE